MPLLLVHHSPPESTAVHPSHGDILETLPEEPIRGEVFVIGHRTSWRSAALYHFASPPPGAVSSNGQLGSLDSKRHFVR